jgi:hypothetical protein
MGGKPQAHSLELDRGLGLYATSVHRASFPEAFCFGWLTWEGQGVCRSGGQPAARPA